MNQDSQEKNLITILGIRNVLHMKILECFLVFIAVPIRSFKTVVQEIAQYKLYNTTIVDVCSVKIYPVGIMENYLPDHVGIIASHPHFGPDSYSPFRELKITLCQVRDTYKRYNELKEFFESRSISIIKILKYTSPMSWKFFILKYIC